MKKISYTLLVFILVFNLVGCGQQNMPVDESVLEADWEAITENVKGTTVNFYGWGGSERTNRWIDEYLKKRIQEEYHITLNRVPMDIDNILSKLLGEKQQNVKKGTIDVVWINGENFYTAKNNELLYGSFTEKLPNFNDYIDQDSVEVKMDFGFPIDGYEAPYGKAQFALVYDQERLDQAPKNHLELLEMAKNNPGKFTYPAPPDFTGSAFVRNVIYDIVGPQQFMDMEPNQEIVREAVQPAMDFLKELKPYLWNQGKTYPATIAQLDNMYADNEVFNTMTYHPYAVAGRIATGTFSAGSQIFLFDKGTIGNTHFLAIPQNAPNKAGALAVINFILSPEAQASKYDPENWGDLSVLSFDQLSIEEKKRFEAIKIGEGVLPIEELLSHRVPEMPADLIPIIEEIWSENILKGE